MDAAEFVGDEAPLPDSEVAVELGPPVACVAVEVGDEKGAEAVVDMGIETAGDVPTRGGGDEDGVVEAAAVVDAVSPGVAAIVVVAACGAGSGIAGSRSVGWGEVEAGMAEIVADPDGKLRAEAGAGCGEQDAAPPATTGCTEKRVVPKPGGETTVVACAIEVAGVVTTFLTVSTFTPLVVFGAEVVMAVVCFGVVVGVVGGGVVLCVPLDCPRLVTGPLALLATADVESLDSHPAPLPQLPGVGWGCE